ncbi:hypothetical protein GCM10009624_25260 [Gordonia sinesedis]
MRPPPSPGKPSERPRPLTTGTSGQADPPGPDAIGSRPVGAPDARFTLAAERTVLAWVRTALGFIAGGVAIVFVSPGRAETAIGHHVSIVLGLVMVGLGCGIAILGGYRWRRTDRVLREGGTMPGSSQVLVVVAAIVVVAIAVAVTIVI